MEPIQALGPRNFYWLSSFSSGLRVASSTYG